jgi:nucleoside-diphosphate-sugar epimerase
MKILVTGGCGYQGSILVPKLLKEGHKVIVVDTMWFNNYLKKNKNLRIFKKDIRYFNFSEIKKIDTIIHLAAVANDPMADLSEKHSWEISTLGTMNIIEQAIKYRVKNFIFASSSSVYGIKKEKKVHEGLKLEPISTYNKAKMITERILLSYKNKINLTIIRPATVCGFSPRMRLDVSVNMLTYQALTKGKITVFGGKQIRPNIHIDDLVDLYLFIIKKKISGIYNAGFENLSILNIAKKIKKKINCEIKIIKNNIDVRSYRVDSSKLLNKGFRPKKTIDDAVNEINYLFKIKKLKNDKSFFSINWLKNNKNKLLFNE